MRLLLLILILVSNVAFSQRYSFIQYTTSKGLPQSQVTSITQDDAGYLWVGTIGGLAKFDGTNFSKFGKNSGLLKNRISKVQNINGQLYIGHPQGISIKTSPANFVAIPFFKEDLTGDVTGFASFNTDIYFSTNGAGLFKLNESDLEIKSIDDSPERIRDIVNINGLLYLATRDGIHSFDGEKFEALSNSEEISFSGFSYKNGQFFATSYNGTLYAIDISHKKINTIFENDDFLFRNVLSDHAGNKWLHSSDGIILIKAKDTIYFSETSGLPSNDINAVFEDRENNIWIGTNGKGLVKFTNEIFTYYNERSGFPSDLIISMEIDKKGNKWFSSIDQGVFVKNRKGEIRMIDSIPSAVWQITTTEDLVLFASDYGLFTYDYNRIRAYYKEDNLPSNRIIGIHDFNDSLLIISTSDGGVGFDKRLMKIVPLKNNLTEISRIRALKHDKKYSYVAAENKVYIIKDGKVSHQGFDAGVNSIEVDANGELWLGTENGLYQYTEGKFSRYILDKEGELEYINFIQAYDSSIFIGTNNGLYEINVVLRQKYKYNINSGLIDLETNLNSNYIENNQYLWFGTASGLMKINLKERYGLQHEMKPKLQLTHLLINNKNIDQSQIYSINKQHHLSPLKIRFADKNIIFNFDGIYMSNPEDLRYTYFLEGSSEEWSNPSKNSTVNFANLSPGKYLFKFQAINSNNVSDIFEIPIQILPPFYATWWFFLICGVGLILVLYLIEKNRTRIIRQKNYQLKLEYQHKLTKLEQQSLNANMNRHFIFNSLNSIQYYINISDTKAANKYLSRFAKLIRKNLDSSNVEDGMVSLADEVDRLELYLELEGMRFIDKFDYTIRIDKQVETEALKVPTMLLQPFVENSIIHGVLPLKNKKGKITIEITDHLEYVMIKIIDNGVGIDFSRSKKSDSEPHVSQGMLITKKRIELLQKFSERAVSIDGPHQINESDSSINGTEVTFKILKQYLG